MKTKALADKHTFRAHCGISVDGDDVEKENWRGIYKWRNNNNKSRKKTTKNTTLELNFFYYNPKQNKN